MSSLPHVSRAFLVLLAPLTLSPAQDDPRTAWVTFQRTHGPHWHARWNAATGTPESIHGPGLALGAPVRSLDAARAAAADVLHTQRDLLGTGTSNFVEEIGARVRDTWVFVHRQEHHGLEVVGGRADVRVHAAGVVSAFGARCIPVPEDLALAPALPSSAARAIARRALEVHEEAGRAERLVLFGDPLATTPVRARLAWEIAIHAPREGREGRAYVDAHSGALLSFHDARHECTTCATRAAAPTNVTGNVRGWVNVDRLPNAPLTEVPLQGLAVRIVGGGSAFCDANGDFDIPHAGTAPVTVRIDLSGEHLASMVAEQGTRYDRTFTAVPGTPLQITVFGPGATQYDRSQTTAFWHVDQVNRFTRGILGNLPQLAWVDAVDAVVNRASSCNATYNALSNTVTFYHDSGQCPNTAFNSVVAHEWGHGLDEAFGGIERNEGQSEGSADIVSILYNDDPVIGPDFFGPGTNVRTATNNLTYPQGGSVHQMGEPWMGFCWDVRNGLVTALGTTAGLQRLRDLFLGVFVTDPTSHPDAVLQVFLLDDDDGNLNNGTPNYDVLEAAALRRRFPYPQRTEGSLDFYGLGCPGTGDPHVACFEQNAGETLAGYSNLRPFLIEVTATSAETILGYEMRTSSTTGRPVTANTYVYRSQAGAPAPTPLRTSTMLVGIQPNWYRTHLLPFSVAAGEVFYVGFDASRDFHVPQTLAGTPSQYYVDLGFGWFGPFADPMATRLICPTAGGGAEPLLSVDGIPAIGRTLNVNLAQGPASTTAFLCLGASAAQWFGLALPFDLGGAGAPGCAILAAWDLPFSAPTDAYGYAALSFPTPNDPRLLWLEVFQQWAVFDPAANPLGLTVSRAARAVIGM